MLCGVLHGVSGDGLYGFVRGVQYQSQSDGNVGDRPRKLVGESGVQGVRMPAPPHVVHQRRTDPVHGVGFVAQCLPSLRDFERRSLRPLGHAVPVGGHGRPHVSPGVGTERRQLPGHRADDARLLHGALHRRFRRRPLYGGVSGTRRPRPATVRYAAIDLRTALRGFGVGQQPLRCFEIAQIAFARPALRRRHGQMEAVHQFAAPAAADALHQPRRGVGHIGTYPFARFAADALSAVREQ